MTRFLVAAVAALLTLLSLALPARADFARPIHERRLANGLRVIVSPDPAATDVALVVRYDVGSRDEPTSLEGLAHLVEHVMFLGSKHAPRGRFGELLDAVGAVDVNGTTSVDATVYHETLPPEQLELGLWLESDRMGYLLDGLDDSVFRRAQAEVTNEYRARVTEVPLGATLGIERAELFPAWHPYRHLPVGTPAALGGGIGLADVRAFVSTWYGPGNAMVVVAGKVDPPAAMALAERYFGTLPARPPPGRPALPEITRTAHTLATVAAGVVHAEVRVAWVTPPYGARDDVALDVAAAILTGRGAGWLHKALMGARSLATQVGSIQHSQSLASIFEIHAIVGDQHKPREVLDEIGRALGRFDTDVTEAEIDRAKRIWQAAQLFGLESSLAWAQRIALEAQSGPLPALFDGRVAHHASVRPDEVRGAVRRWLATRPAVFVVSVPTRGWPQSGVVVSRQEVAR